MSVLTNAALALAVSGEGLTLHSILVDIPHDAAAFVVYALTIVSVGWVVKAGRQKPDGDAGDGDRG